MPALCEYVVDTSRGTTIAQGEARVSTIEHIMSALWTLGVDNALVDINAPETPIMDGSAREYAAEIHRVGIVEQSHRLCRLLLHRLWRELVVAREDYRVDISLVGGLPLGTTLFALEVALLSLLGFGVVTLCGGGGVADDTDADGKDYR